MALSGLCRSKLKCFIASSCSRQIIVKTALPLRTSALEDNDARKGINYMQCRERRKIHIPELKPIEFSSGDLVPYEPPPRDEILYKYQHLAEIKDYPPDLRKLFTVAYATSREKLEHQHMKIQDKVFRKTGHGLNYEKMIAYLTVKIRYAMMFSEKNRQNKKAKHHTFQRIERRYKLLKYLKLQDINRFNWLVEELKIDYDQRLKKQKMTSKEQIFEEAKNEMLMEKERKREEVRQQFEVEKEAFLQHKKEVIANMKVEADKHRIDLKEVLKSFKQEQIEKQKALEAKPVKMGINFVKYHEEEKKRKEKQLRIIPNPYVLGVKQ